VSPPGSCSTRHESVPADILVVMDDRDADAFRALYRRHYRKPPSWW
jgi:hypothetical protein